MKAACIKAYGDVDQLVIREMTIPKPQAGEVLIKIAASAVNHFDLIIRRGEMAKFIPLGLPAVLGGDAAGTLVEVGAGVTGFAVGDRVIADFAPNGRGANAEYGVVPASAIARLPANLTFEQGAALPKAGLTGRQAVEALAVKAGERVLISGGLGMVGRAAIQYLQEIGARPVAGVRAARLAEARELAGEALDITEPPANATFDFAISAAAPVATNLIAHVRDNGRVVSIVPVPQGTNAGSRVIINELYHRTDASILEAVAQAVSRDALTIPVAMTFPLDQIDAAHNAVAAGVDGKVVLRH